MIQCFSLSAALTVLFISQSLFLNLTNQCNAESLQTINENLKKQLPEQALIALSDLVRLGASWRQSRYLTFCDKPNAPRSVDQCPGSFMRYNASSCSCYSTFEKPNYGKSKSSNLLAPAASVSSTFNTNSMIDWNWFFNDAALNGLHEAICDIQLGTIVTPQINNLPHLRYPYAFTGPVCTGYSLHGESCIPYETVKINQQVDKVIYNPKDGLLHVIDEESITLELPKSCYDKCMLNESSCSANQVFDRENCICKCKWAPKTCTEGQHWDISFCQCSCKTSADACGSGTRFDVGTCRCISPYTTTTSPQLKARPQFFFEMKDREENCRKLVACLNASIEPYFDRSDGTCKCLMTPKLADCSSMKCQNEDLSAIFDFDRNGCVCPCSKVSLNNSCTPYLCPLKS